MLSVAKSLGPQVPNYTPIVGALRNMDRPTPHSHTCRMPVPPVKIRGDGLRSSNFALSMISQGCKGERGMDKVEGEERAEPTDNRVRTWRQASRGVVTVFAVRHTGHTDCPMALQHNGPTSG